MNQAKVKAMKKAYARFLKLATRLANGRAHAAHLLVMNSGYNEFIRGLQ